jgi:hypothetical protein
MRGYHSEIAETKRDEGAPWSEVGILVAVPKEIGKAGVSTGDQIHEFDAVSSAPLCTIECFVCGL